MFSIGCATYVVGRKMRAIQFVAASFARFGVSFLFGADGAEVVVNKKMYAIGVRSLVVGRNDWGIVFCCQLPHATNTNFYMFLRMSRKLRLAY